MNQETPIFTFLLIFIDIYILVSLRQLEKETSKCQCAQTWHSRELVWVGSVTLISRMMKLIYREPLLQAIQKKKTDLVVPLILDFALSVYYIYLIVKYVMVLQKNKCNCLGPVHDVLHYYAYTLLFVGVLMVLFVGLSLVVGSPKLT